MGKERPNYYSGDMEATVPTPPDQQDVNALDMVADAVEDMVDTIRDDIGLEDDTAEKGGGDKESGAKRK